MNLAIKKLRKNLRISQTEFAKAVGVSLRTVGSWERGESLPNAEQIWACAVALNCSPNDILGWEEVKPMQDMFERELVECYRACTPSRQDRILDTARDAAGMSKEAPEHYSSEPQQQAVGF